MHLKIIAELNTEDVYGITLGDGRFPSISTLTDAELQQFQIPDIEPALWFKVLALKEITVDCNQRVLTWMTASKESSIERNSSRKSLCEGKYGEADKDFDGVLFDLFNKLVKQYAAKGIQKLAYYKEVLRILHCYILPEISFDKNDIETLQAVCDVQMQLIYRHDERILEKSSDIDRISSSMKRQRESYFQHIETGLDEYLLHLPGALLLILLSHLQEDITAASQALADAQTEVNLVKYDIQLSPQESNELWKKLDSNRQHRNAVHDGYARLLLLREKISSYVSMNTLKRGVLTQKQIRTSKLKVIMKNKVEDPLHKIYLEMDQMRSDRVKELSQLIEQKVKLLSVKEAAVQALEELNETDVTYGLSLDPFKSRRCTDVLKDTRPAIPMEWRTLGEKWDCMLHSSKHLLAKRHLQGLERILGECKILCKLHQRYINDELNLSTDGTIGSINIPTWKGSDISLECGDAAYIHNHSGSKNIFADLMCIGLRDVSSYGYGELPKVQPANQLVEVEDFDGDTVIIVDSSSDYAKQALEKLQIEIVKHCEGMCEEFQKELHMPGKENYIKVWTSYGRIFFASVMPSLEQISRIAFSNQLRGLREGIPLLTLGNMEIDNNLMIVILEDLVIPVPEEDIHRSIEALDHVIDDEISETESVDENTHPVIYTQRISLPELRQTPKPKKVKRRGTFLYPSSDESSSEENDEYTHAREQFSRITPPLETTAQQLPSACEPHDLNNAKKAKSLEGVLPDISTSTTSSVNHLHLAEEFIAAAAAGQLYATDSDSKPASPSKYSTIIDKINMDIVRNSHSQIKIFQPTFWVFSQDRRTWPLATEDEIEMAEDAFKLNKYKKNKTRFVYATVAVRKPRSALPVFSKALYQSKSVHFKEEYLRDFIPLFMQIKELLNTDGLMDKIQLIFSFLETLSITMRRLHKRILGKELVGGADELTDMLNIFLCNCSIPDIEQLYIQVIVLRDMLPKSLETGPYGWAVMQFVLVFHYLYDRIVLMRKLLS